jgi:lactoylglutathione lyase
MGYTLDHIHFRCRDVDLSAVYYEKMFNARRVGSGNAQGMPITILEVGGQRFALSPKRDDVHIAVGPDEPGWGIYQIGFKVENADTALEELRAKGAQILRGPLVVRPGVRVFFVQGPDGVEIEIMEYA